MGIGQKLRHRRINLGLSRSQLAKMIHVTPSAIANYENGVSYPKPDILISLIIALEVDANYLYQDYLSNSKVRTLYGQELTRSEEEAISKYSKLTESGKQLVHMIIDEEYQRKLTEEWVEYLCIQPGIRKLHSGFLLKQEECRVRFKKKYQFEKMEFCFQIQVDQHEPVYKKYSVLALKSSPAVHNEIGIFRLNDIYYLCTLYQIDGKCRLRPLNVNEPDIVVSDTDKFECIGTVLGQIYGTYEIVPDDKLCPGS